MNQAFVNPGVTSSIPDVYNSYFTINDIISNMVQTPLAHQHMIPRLVRKETITISKLTGQYKTFLCQLFGALPYSPLCTNSSN